MDNIKVLKGDNLQQNTDLYSALSKLPPANKKFGLNADQKYWYRFFGLELLATNKLTKVDLIHLCKIAVAVTMYQEAILKMNVKGYDGGVIQTFKNGVEQISPHITVQEKATKQIDEVSKHFGFSFKDRYNLNIPKPEVTEQTSLWEEFNNQRQSS